MPFNSITVGQLSDKRLQLFASLDGVLHSTWKTSADPNASWTDWSLFAPNATSDYAGITLGAAAQRSDGALQLLAFGGEFNPVGVLGGPVAITTRKVSADSTAEWSDWEGLYAGQFGPQGSPDTGVDALAVAALSDGRLQAFFSEGAVGGSGPVENRVMTRWQRSADAHSDWVDATPFAPAPPEYLAPVTVAALTDGRLQAWGSGQSGIWTTWKETTDPDSGWLGWSPFMQLPNDPFIASFAAGTLSDGRPQLFAVGAESNVVYSTWKQTTDPDAAWAPWQQFFGSDVIDVAVAPLSDGRLQFFALKHDGTMFSVWKASTDPNADWTSPSQFPVPVP